MRAVNRSVLVVRPKDPFILWAVSIDDDAKQFEASLRERIAVYLVPQDPREVNESAPLKGFFEAVFEAELENWCTDSDLWPKNVTLKLFNQWFETKANSLVWDIVDGPLFQEDW